MKTVLFLSATSRGQALNATARSFAEMYAAHGYDFEFLDLAGEGKVQRLKDVLRLKKVAFAMGMAGFTGNATLPKKDGSQGNLWETLGIPFFALLGDAPAYFFDRHVAPTRMHALLYGFPDHLMLRKRLPQINGAMSVIPHVPISAVPFESIDFAKKLGGSLLFLKNGNDAPALVRAWQRTLEPSVAQALIEMADALTTGDAIDECHGTQIDDMIIAYYGQCGIDIETMPKLRVLLHAHLDDYVRRIKSTLMARTLMDFPVVIHGENWEHLDFSKKRCTFIPGSDFERSNQMMRESLGVIDMSPNTTFALHDRVTRAFGAFTYCMTNEQQILSEMLPSHHQHMTFRFNRDSIAERVSQVLANPRRTIEIGAESAEIFRARYTEENFVKFTVLLADSMRQSMAPRPEGLQEFIVWPPEQL
jgi:hypothetical protein